MTTLTDPPLVRTIDMERMQVVIMITELRRFRCQLVGESRDIMAFETKSEVPLAEGRVKLFRVITFQERLVICCVR
jgi:hypothetical protein